MKRRSFVKTSLLSAAAAGIIPLENKAAIKHISKNAAQEFYELRVYTFKTAEQEKITEDYFAKAAVPAFNRAGIQPIGVFKELKPELQTKLFVLIPFKSIEAYIGLHEKLLTNPTYLQAGADYLNATATAPAYDRMESSLLKAFEHMPALMPPVRKPRIFELRHYESATEMAGKKKIDMFNDKGEIDVFKRLGFSPVFFGETIFGALRPNLMYMISFDDMDSHDAHWKMFGSDPQWKKISAVPEYADAKIVSHISSSFLVPAECSQV